MLIKLSVSPLIRGEPLKINVFMLCFSFYSKFFICHGSNSPQLAATRILPGKARLGQIPHSSVAGKIIDAGGRRSVGMPALYYIFSQKGLTAQPGILKLLIKTFSIPICGSNEVILKDVILSAIPFQLLE